MKNDGEQEAAQDQPGMDLDDGMLDMVAGRLDLGLPKKDEGEEKAEGGARKGSPDVEEGTKGTPEAAPEELKREEGAPADDPEEEELTKAKLTPAQQASVNKRIGKEVARRKSLEEELAAERTTVVELRSQLTENSGRVAGSQGVNELYLVKNEGELDARVDKILQFRRWAREHKDGTEGSADGKSPGYTAEEIADRLEELEEERSVVIPRVREHLRKKEQVDRYARVVYPELFDAKHKANEVMQNVLAAVPALARYPNVSLVIGDMLAGQQLRMAQEKKAQAGGKAEAPKAPRVPASPASASRTPTGAREKAGKGVSAERFMAGGGGADALKTETAALVADLLG